MHVYILSIYTRYIFLFYLNVPTCANLNLKPCHARDMSKLLQFKKIFTTTPWPGCLLGHTGA